MGEMVACPDCGTPNKTDADLCAQCWRPLSDDVISKIPVAAFAAPGHVAPPPPAAPRRIPAPRPAPEPVRPREAEPGPVPYFAPAFAPAGGCVTPAAGLSAPATPLGATATSKKVPWGSLIALTVVLALLGGGYFFFFGRSSGAFSPEDGSYSVVLPEGWVPIEELDGEQPQIDAAVRSESNQSAIMVGHWPMPAGVTKEQLSAGMSFAQRFMPRFPGVTMGAFRESNAVSGEGVVAFEMTASATAGLVPGGRGKMRLVFAVEEGSPTFALLVVACSETECPRADATFDEMAQTFEFSG